MFDICSNLSSKMSRNMNVRDIILSGIHSHLGSNVIKPAVPVAAEQPVEASVVNVLKLVADLIGDLRVRANDSDRKQKNLREAVKRVISGLETVNHDTTDVRDKLSSMLDRLDDVDDVVSVTNAKLESHIEVSDQRHTLAEDKIAEVVSLLAASKERHDVSDERHDVSDERHDVSEHRHDLTDGRFFDVMQYVTDLQERVSGLEAGASASKARADEHEDDLDYVMPLVRRYDLNWQQAQIAMEGSLLDMD